MSPALNPATDIGRVRALTEHEATTGEIFYGRVFDFPISMATTQPTHIDQLPRLRETVMLTKIRKLSPARRAELTTILDDMIDKESKARHNEAVINALAALADEPFRRIWDNPKDAEYDSL